MQSRTLSLEVVPQEMGSARELARMQHDPSEVRCRCLVCGAHAFARPDVPMSAACGNCHSFELEPLEPGPVPRRRITGTGRQPVDLPPAALTA